MAADDWFAERKRHAGPSLAHAGPQRGGTKARKARKASEPVGACGGRSTPARANKA